MTGTKRQVLTNRRDRDQWAEMMRLAESRRLAEDDLPTFGQGNPNGRLDSFVDWGTTLLPAKAGGDLLLGKIGRARFGSHFGSDELFAAYRLVEGQLEPVAGFYLEVSAHRCWIRA